MHPLHCSTTAICFSHVRTTKNVADPAFTQRESDKSSSYIKSLYVACPQNGSRQFAGYITDYRYNSEPEFYVPGRGRPVAANGRTLPASTSPRQARKSVWGAPARRGQVPPYV